MVSLHDVGRINLCEDNGNSSLKEPHNEETSPKVDTAHATETVLLPIVLAEPNKFSLRNYTFLLVKVGLLGR